MWYEIVEIVEQQPESIRAVVNHGNRQVPVTIVGKNTKGLSAGKSFPGEIGYDEIVSWKVLSDFEDTQSGIWQEQDGIHLLGRVRTILDFGDGKSLIDMYMQSGPEVYTVDAEEIGDAGLESNDGLEITVGKLYVYPVEY